jgi:hypothetical protein
MTSPTVIGRINCLPYSKPTVERLSVKFPNAQQMNFSSVPAWSVSIGCHNAIDPIPVGTYPRVDTIF